jgi:hypothetical protein
VNVTIRAVKCDQNVRCHLEVLHSKGLVEEEFNLFSGSGVDLDQAGMVIVVQLPRLDFRYTPRPNSRGAAICRDGPRTELDCNKTY